MLQVGARSALGGSTRVLVEASPSLADAELRQAGCAQIFAEKVSGARIERKELARALKRLAVGEVLIVTRLSPPLATTTFAELLTSRDHRSARKTLL
jgi:resolvase-like protein